MIVRADIMASLPYFINSAYMLSAPTGRYFTAASTSSLRMGELSSSVSFSIVVSPLLSWLYKSEPYYVKRVNTSCSSVRNFPALSCMTEILLCNKFDCVLSTSSKHCFCVEMHISSAFRKFLVLR